MYPKLSGHKFVHYKFAIYFSHVTQSSIYLSINSLIKAPYFWPQGYWVSGRFGHISTQKKSHEQSRIYVGIEYCQGTFEAV